ncbi:hypothetical protein [Labrenzia sp. VG12]|nr:hypothetical protein [Labrenzia sp. VG12]
MIAARDVTIEFELAGFQIDAAIPFDQVMGLGAGQLGRVGLSPRL